MERIKFFFKRLVKMDFKAMWKTTHLLKKKSGKNRIWLLIDMLKCAVKYNAGYIDYKIAQMYRLTDEQRKTVITRGISNSIVRRMNEKEYWHFFDDKSTFNTLFSEDIKRQWILVTPEIKEKEMFDFLENKDCVMYKPLEGSSGQGIRKIYADEWNKDFKVFFSDIIYKGNVLLEEVIKQHEHMNKMCSTSVNTIRVATLLGSKRQGIVYAFLRIGVGNVMDNVDCGGMAARVDLDSGKLLTVGADKQGNTFTKHPITNTDIIGFEIPYWQEIKDMCIKASQKVPQMRFIAWDVAVTPEGPTFIEGNSFPSHAVPQFAAHYPNNVGILHEFKKFIDL